jgi:hypothetical protein
VPVFIAVVSDRHHVLVVAAHQLVAGGDEKFHVVNLGARLVETFN